MDEEWVWLWFRCLKLNKPYKRYCEMRRTKARKERTTLEKQYPQIAEVYEDFGDIHAFNERSQSRKNWKEWFQTRKHLFISVESLTTFKIEVQLGKTKKAAIAEATKQIRASYPKPVSTAKYQLALKQVSDVSLKALRKSLNVWHVLKPLKSSAPKAAEVIYLLTNNKIGRKEDWDWLSTYQDDEEKRRQVLRFRKETQHIIDNTIHGVFPVRIPS